MSLTDVVRNYHFSEFEFSFENSFFEMVKKHKGEINDLVSLQVKDFIEQIALDLSFQGDIADCLKFRKFSNFHICSL